jgi:SAM-dependent methyltransferase
MSNDQSINAFTGDDAYEQYVGRWSRPVAQEFIDWLEVPSGGRWLDVGCGTGALTENILFLADPVEVYGVDPTRGYVALSSQHIGGERAHFDVGDAQNLPAETAAYDAVVSGLVLNFIPDVEAGLAEMVRAAVPGGTVALYVWDYAGKMELMRYFWDAAVALRPEDQIHDEGTRFPICQPDPLNNLLQTAGLQNVEVRSIDVPTKFRDFEDYWSPFEGGQGPAPGYLMSLSEEDREALEKRVRANLPIEQDGSIRLTARAWAVRGKVA